MGVHEYVLNGCLVKNQFSIVPKSKHEHSTVLQFERQYWDKENSR